MITKQKIKDALKKGSWIVGIFLLAALVWGAITFKDRFTTTPDNTTVNTQANTPVSVSSAEVGKTTPATPPAKAEKVVRDVIVEIVPEKPSQEEVRVEPARVPKPVKNFVRQNGGTVINQVGKPVRKNGKTFLPIFLNGKVPTEPTGTDVWLVQGNMTLEGVTLPKGRLAVYDVVLGRNGHELNILAWEVAE